MSLKTLVLVRHGESIRDIAKDARRCSQCYRDEVDRQQVGVNSDQLIPLSPKGLEQAKRVGEALRDNFGQFDLIVNSGYVRARQTTARILDAYTPEYKSKALIWETPLIRERDPGLIYFWTEAEVQKHFPWFWDYWDNTDILYRVAPEGESLLEMSTTRLPLFLRELEDRISRLPVVDARVLIVSHSRAIQGLRFVLEGWSYERFRDEVVNNYPPNGSVTVYHRGPDCWHLDMINKVF
jgi:broad specificity phosphatase PhoE